MFAERLWKSSPSSSSVVKMHWMLSGSWSHGLEYLMENVFFSCLMSNCGGFSEMSTPERNTIHYKSITKLFLLNYMNDICILDIFGVKWTIPLMLCVRKHLLQTLKKAIIYNNLRITCLACNHRWFEHNFLWGYQWCSLVRHYILVIFSKMICVCN